MLSMRPPWLAPHSSCGQPTPAEREFPPMNQRSQATVRVVQQVVANDPVELLVGMMCRDALVESLSVVGVVLLRLGFPVELRRAPAGFAAVANRGPAVPVEARAHLEIRREAVVQPAQHVPRVQHPGLVARRVARDVIRGSGPIGVHHQRGDFGRHLTAQRIAGRNTVARIRIANRVPR